MLHLYVPETILGIGVKNKALILMELNKYKRETEYVK